MRLILRLRVAALAALMLWTLVAPAAADTIIDVSGTSNGRYPFDPARWPGFSWTAGSSYTDVAITVPFQPINWTLMGSQFVGTAWLTTQIGGGATAADVIAQSSFALSSPAASRVFFSGLTLGPGTYYALFSITNGEGDLTALNVPSALTVIVTAPAVSMGQFYFSHSCCGQNAAFPPAGDWIQLSTPGTSAFPYSITGTPSVPEATVPEPATMFLLGAGVVVEGLQRRWRRSMAPRSHTSI